MNNILFIKILIVFIFYSNTISSQDLGISLEAFSTYSPVTLSKENFIYSVKPQIAIDNLSEINSCNDVIEQVSYFDGLGRKSQDISVKQSPSKQDVVTHYSYDNFGRKTHNFLPVIKNPNLPSGSMIINNIENTIKEYYHEKYPEDFNNTEVINVNPYSESLYQSSPLNRVVEQGSPGESWQIDPNSNTNNTIKFDWDSNTEEDSVTLFSVTINATTENPSLNQDGEYASNQLYKSITKDENWQEVDNKNHTTEEFKNKQGQVILKRTYNNNEPHDTYYVYDDYGNLTYVLPPKVDTTDGVSATEQSQLCYQYKYDYRNRLVEKKIPGKGWEYIVYNALDLPVVTQDAIQREHSPTKQWLVTKYDAFGRVAFTGLHESNVSLQQAQANGMDTDSYEQFVEKKETPTLIAGTNVYYTNETLPRTIKEVYTINYYDNYTFDLAEGTKPTGAIFGQYIEDNVKGLFTGSKVRILGTNNWITTVTYYDSKARPIYVYSKNEYLNTVDITKTLYDFTGRVLKTRSSHIKDDNEPIVTQDIFTYDHAGRLIDQHQCIGNDTLSEYCGESDIDIVDHLEIEDEVINTTETKTAGVKITLLPSTVIEAPTSGEKVDFIIAENAGVANSELIAHNTYDELGQLESKKVGNTIANPLQTVDYSHNIRGWLKQINDPSSALSDDLFAFKLNYNTTDLDGSTALFNGNISETHWKTKNDNVARNYRYDYDALNRINAATSNEPSKYNLLRVVYDKMGNIEGFTRMGAIDPNATTFGVMDQLIYLYTGNQLQSVSELSGGSINFGFKDGNTSGNDYAYDANGNMITDLNKGIQSISYNHLNLPILVAINSTTEDGSIHYVYDAAGIKQQKQVFENGVATSITDYAGNFLYENEELKFFNHPEGYIESTNGTDAEDGFTYVYQYMDHLGNIRLSYADADADGFVDVNEIREEKNYYPFGLVQKGYNNTINGRQHNYGFIGKEENKEIGLEWVDFGARNYDAAIGRWMNIDPMANRNHSWTPFRYSYNNPTKFVDPDGLYERDGHYWTVYLAATIAGYQNAATIAYWAEEPDHVMSAMGDVGLATETWKYPRNQREWHALTASDSYRREETISSSMYRNATSIQEKGYALHRLGDSFAHSKEDGSMYGKTYFGHAHHNVANGIGATFNPDYIRSRPQLYMEYVRSLTYTIGGKADGGGDFFTFNYVANSGGDVVQNSAVFETEIRIREGVSTFSVLGDQTGVIGDYMSARNENYGTSISHKTITAEADSYKLNEETGEWEKSGVELRTFIILGW